MTAEMPISSAWFFQQFLEKDVKVMNFVEYQKSLEFECPIKCSISQFIRICDAENQNRFDK